MFKLGNLSVLAVMGVSFYAGRKSVGEGPNLFNEGVEEGYARALVTLNVFNKLSVEDVELFMKKGVDINA